VELIGISPPVWREILVPARYSFWDLHVAIQDAMGWLDYHLHEFRIRGSSRDDTLLIGIPSDDVWDDAPVVLPGWDIQVIDILSERGDGAEYEYDFGDGWIHEITLLGVEPREKGQRYPLCIAGERACPPEDCGGIPGYESLLEVLFDPSHPEHESLSQWIPQGWGPELFKPEKVRFDNPLKRWKKAFSAAGIQKRGITRPGQVATGGVARHMRTWPSRPAVRMRSVPAGQSMAVTKFSCTKRNCSLPSYSDHSHRDGHATVFGVLQVSAARGVAQGDEASVRSADCGMGPWQIDR
jgi:hypothetical protein